jgi:predicted metallo-beta-lactamase superfamily hydrolase
MMFEEINQKLDKANRQIEKIGQNQPEVSDNNEKLELKSAIENLYDSQSQRLHAIENAIRTEKRKIEFTPTSTFGMAFLFSLMLMLLAMAVILFQKVCLYL